MTEGLKSLKLHDVAFDRIVLANLAQLSQLDRDKLKQSAEKRGATIEAVYDRGFFASRLRRDGAWRSRLLGLSAEPISLARTPTDLAESPWSRLPLIGRDGELAKVSAIGTDIVLSGAPGVGKTRLLAAIPDVYFVDHHADFGRLADDIRWLEPKLLVVDDAGSAKQLIEQLRRLRAVESDVAKYRIIGACWPDETAEVGTWLGSEEVVELELVERGALNQVLVQMGITSQLARSEVLGQAEGRPGWAIALGDILLRSRDGSSLLNGKALYGQVQRYLRRASVPSDATDLLATVAAVGGFTDTEIGELATELGMSKPETVRLLGNAAKSGLVDVVSRYDQGAQRNLRRYSIRPPMLADVLAAERAFGADVPGADLRALAQCWPTKLAAIAESAIDSALLSAKGARSEAEYFYLEAIGAPGAQVVDVLRISQHFARVDRQAAEVVLAKSREAYHAWVAGGGTDPWQVEGVINLGYLIARWYLLDAAVELLLDAALTDSRLTGPNPDHPLRKLADLTHAFHPEVPRPSDQRMMLARVADAWVALDPSDRHWSVYAYVAAAVLSLYMSSTLPDPGDPRTVQIIQTVAPADEARKIYEQAWPRIKPRLADAPHGVLKTVLHEVEEWLRIGKGVDPLSGDRPPGLVDAARELGELMLTDLVPLVAGSPGLATSLKEIAERFGVPVDVDVDDTYAPLFVDIDHTKWREETERLEESIGQVVGAWANDDPLSVIQRVVDVRVQLELSGRGWPDRTVMACQALARAVSEPLTWSDLALERGLFPKASPFLERVVEQGIELGEERLVRYLANPAARDATVMQILVRGSRADYELLLGKLGPQDYGAFTVLFVREQLTPDRTKDLLTKPSSDVRGAAAAAVSYWGLQGGEWSPGVLASEWLDAIALLNPETTLGFGDTEAGELAQFLAVSYPDTLVRWVRSRMESGVAAANLYGSLSHSTWGALHALPPDRKTQLWLRFKDTPSGRFLLSRSLAGTDVAWVEEVLNDGHMTADQALETYNGLGAHGSIEQYARLLIPKGVAPEAIARLASAGTWMGEMSARYATLLANFQAMAGSEEPEVAEVGHAGIEIFSTARDAALDQERLNRVRGEL
jgi:hypothetical protein